jgi:hypothetical protein
VSETSLARRGGAVVNREQLALSVENYQEILKRPLALVPERLRQPLLAVHLLTRHLKGLETPLSLATTVALAMDREGLTPDDAVMILDVMTRSHMTATYDYPAIVTTTLSRKIADAVERQRKLREQARRREESQMPVDPDAREAVRNLAAAFGGPSGG